MTMGIQKEEIQSCVGHDPREGTASGYDTRIGLEDTLTLPGGQLAKDNAELVAHAIRKARQIGGRYYRAEVLHTGHERGLQCCSAQQLTFVHFFVILRKGKRPSS